MTQHMASVPSKRNLEEDFPSPERKKSILQAKKREAFDVGNWEQLNWYVKVANLDFGELSVGDLLNLQDEVAALCSIVDGRVGGRPLLPLKNLKAVHQKISTHLVDLVDNFSTKIGPFASTTVISRLRKILKNHPESTPEMLEKIPRVNISKRYSHCKTQEDMIATILLAHLAELLSEFGDSIIRCLKCHQLFLQFRRQAECCSRRCQSQRAAEITRQKKKAEEAKAKPSQKKRQGSATKRRK